MKIEYNKQSYERVYEHFAYCGGCNLLKPCGLHLSRCEIDGFYRSFCLPNYRFAYCHNTSIFKI
jgi:hypothetical protein